MNILTVSHPGNPKLRHGGFESFVGLARKGHNISFLTSLNKNELPYEFFRGVHIFRSKPIYNLTNVGYQVLFPLLDLRKIVKKQNIDLINGRGFQATNTLCAGVFSRFLSSTPFILTLLGVSITTGNKKLDLMVSLYEHIFKKTLINSSKKVILLGKGLEERARELNVPKEKIVYSYPGIDIERFNPQSHKLNSNNSSSLENFFVIGFVGRFVPLKGIIDLVLASKTVSKKHPVHLLLVGDGPLKTEIERLANSLNIPFTITGIVNNPEKYYPLMDLFVLPSYSEGLSRSCLEAMAMEKPLIVTDIGSNREIVKNNVNGFIINPGTPEVLAEKIIYIIEHKHLLKTWGKINRKIIEKKHTLENEVNSLEKIYSNVLNSNRRKCS